MQIPVAGVGDPGGLKTLGSRNYYSNTPSETEAQLIKKTSPGKFSWRGWSVGAGVVEASYTSRRKDEPEKEAGD